MTIIYQAGYVVPFGDQPLTHARIGHSNNWLKGGVAVASSTATDYTANGPLNSLTYERWQPVSIPATWEYDHTGVAPCDYCAVAAHRLTGCTVNVQFWNGSAWVDLTPPTLINTNSPLMFIFAPVSAERWRLNISAGTPQYVGVIKFGRALQMPRPIYGGHSPLELARITEVRSNKSETGEFVGRTKVRTMLSTEFQWSNIEAAWMRANWKTFQRALEEEPFFIAWRPASFLEVGYGMTDSIPIPQNSGTRDLMNVTLNMRGYAYD